MIFMRFTLLLTCCILSADLGVAQPDRHTMIEHLEQRFGDDVEMQITSEVSPGRCLLPYHQMYDEAGDDLAPATRNRMKQLLAAPGDKPELEEYESESGKFRILYTTEGPDSIPATYSIDPDSVIPDYVIQTAIYADSSYRYQVETLGFVDPTVHQGEQECRNRIGNGEWQDTVITIRYREFGFYGTFVKQRPFEFVVHRNFDGFPENDLEDNRLGALMTTIAHEFKHVIQYATNCMQGDAGNPSRLEMDATMMENIVHPDVNDYYNYIYKSSSIFHSPEYSIPASNWLDSYNHVTWMLFYLEYFGIDFWVKVWNHIHNDHLLLFDEAMSTELELIGRGDNFESALIRNYLWHMAPTQYTSNDGGNFGQNSSNYYGFSEQEFYPPANFFVRYDSLPEFPDKVVETPTRAARFFEFSADEIGAEGQAALALFKDSLGLGVGVLAKTKSGEIQEFVIPSSSANPQKYRMPFDWNELKWMGLVTVNSNNQIPVNQQLFAGVGEAIEHDQLWVYGDITKDDKLTEEDALGMLAYKLNPGLATIFDRYIGDLSGIGEISHYDAALLYRHLDGDDSPFPVDTSGSGKAPKWDRFYKVADDGGTVYPVAKLSPREERTDTVTASLRIDHLAIADYEMDLILSVEGASDSTWNSFYLVLGIDYPPQNPGGSPVSSMGLEFLDIITINGPDDSEGWVYEFDPHFPHTLKLAYASSVPFGSGSIKTASNSPDDLLTLQLKTGSSGKIHFKIVNFQLDEHNYAVREFPLMDTIQVMGPVGTKPPAEQPLAFELNQNYPNPFNPETTISFVLPETTTVRLQVFDITGRLVAKLVDETLHRGRHSVQFDARLHRDISSGVYLYRLEAASQVSVRKMTVIK